MYKYKTVILKMGLLKSESFIKNYQKPTKGMASNVATRKIGLICKLPKGEHVYILFLLHAIS